MGKKTDVIVAGGAVLDALAAPVDADGLMSGSIPAQTRLSTGGDALNEASVLAALGLRVQLQTLVGDDDAGRTIISACRARGIGTEDLKVTAEFPTGVNIVLVDRRGERFFITDPGSTLRRLAPEDINTEAFREAGYFSLASLFVHPLVTPDAAARILSQAKSAGCFVFADMTSRKNGESERDIAGALENIDILFANHSEISLLTGESEVEAAADRCLSAGVGCVAVKCGAEGCAVRTPSRFIRVPAYPIDRCEDTTGAGDTFAACFIYAHSQGMSPADCAAFANAGASICVERVGATGGIAGAEQVLARYERLRNTFETKDIVK